MVQKRNISIGSYKLETWGVSLLMPAWKWCVIHSAFSHANRGSWHLDRVDQPTQQAQIRGEAANHLYLDVQSVLVHA